MKQLREFAQRKPDFEKANAQIVAISVDDQQHARKVFEEAARRNLTILSDPNAEVIRKYGLLHPKGHEDQDIALRTTIVVDEQGREIYRKVSSSVPDLRTADEILAVVRQ
jgi:peroxiredoxin